MLTEKFMDVLAHEGVVSLVSWNTEEPHITNTWNSYIQVTPDQRLLAPAAGMKKLEENVAVNNRIKITLGSREVMGYHSMGTGFALEGTVNFIDSGAEFDEMKAKFPFLNRVLEVTVTSIKQTL